MMAGIAVLDQILTCIALPADTFCGDLVVSGFVIFDPRLPFGCVRKRRIGVSTLELEPVFPILRMIRPLLHFDAPRLRRRIEEGFVAPLPREASGERLPWRDREGLASSERRAKSSPSCRLTRSPPACHPLRSSRHRARCSRERGPRLLAPRRRHPRSRTCSGASRHVHARP
jgi:hypothetical protein